MKYNCLFCIQQLSISIKNYIYDFLYPPNTRGKVYKLKTD